MLTKKQEAMINEVLILFKMVEGDEKPLKIVAEALVERSRAAYLKHAHRPIKTVETAMKKIKEYLKEPRFISGREYSITDMVFFGDMVCCSKGFLIGVPNDSVIGEVLTRCIEPNGVCRVRALAEELVEITENLTKTDAARLIRNYLRRPWISKNGRVYVLNGTVVSCDFAEPVPVQAEEQVAEDTLHQEPCSLQGWCENERGEYEKEVDLLKARQEQMIIEWTKEVDLLKAQHAAVQKEWEKERVELLRAVKESSEGDQARLWQEEEIRYLKQYVSLLERRNLWLTKNC